MVDDIMRYLKAALIVLMILATCAIAYAADGSSSSGGCCVQIVLAPYDWKSDDYSPFKVTLTQIGGTYTTCNSDKDGTVEFSDVPPGYYWVTCCSYMTPAYGLGYGIIKGRYCYYEHFQIYVTRDAYHNGSYAGSDPCSNQYYAHPTKYDCSKDTYKTEFCCKGCPDCIQYAPTGPYPKGTPTIRITAPQNNANVPSGDIPITVEVENFNLVNKLGQASVPGEGHIHYYMDAPLSVISGANPTLAQGTFMATPDKSFTWKNVAPGTHTFTAQLVNNDHTPLIPLAIDQVSISVK